MNINFTKYQGTGNDFVLLDNRMGLFSNVPVKKLCDRRFGIGADGLMLLENAEGFDFKMVYYNSDGNISTMCGNGGRCIVAFARKLGLLTEKASFIAIDGKHEAMISFESGVEIVNLGMNNVNEIEQYDNDFILNTGSPHFVRFLKENEKIETYPVFEEGRKIRQSPRFENEGINVNFVKETLEGIKVRTYERGVEDETLSCGTGVTACAIASYHKNKKLDLSDKIEIPVNTPGGNLKVSFKTNGNNYDDVILSGPAAFVFSGEIEV